MRVKTLPSLCAFLLLVAPLGAATLSGVLFEDRNQDGILDPGETPIEGLEIRLYGTADSGGTQDLTVQTGPGGTYLFNVPDGCYVVQVQTTPDMRIGPVRQDCSGVSPEPYPVGQRRVSSTGSMVDDLAAGSLLHYALGDSIAAGFSICLIQGQNTNYHQFVQNDRMECVSPSAALINAAVSGHTTSHLMRTSAAAGDGNTVEDALDSGADLVSISIGGNDFLDIDPGPGLEPPNQADAELLELCASRAMVSMRANLQEILSSITAGLPSSDVELNTVYDNLADQCGPSTTTFHNRWVPVSNQLLRNLAWGQARRATVAEVWADYAHMDSNGANCCGFDSMICTLDEIHPNSDGRRIHENRLWDSLGGVLLGPRDDAPSSVRTADFGVLQLVDTRRAGSTRDETLDRSSDPDRAIDGANDQGALIPISGGSFFVEEFDAAPRGVTIDRAVVSVRYRGVGTYTDDLYWLEASYDPAFPLPGETLESWDALIPLVGGSEDAWAINTTGAWTCNPLPRPNGTQVLLDPAPADWRTVSTMLTTNVADPNPASGAFSWPNVTFQDLSTLSVRVRSRVVGTADTFQIELDDVWVDLYGVSEPGPDLSGATKVALDTATQSPVTDVAVNDELTYRIELANNGTAPATNIGFQDQIDPCLEFVAGPFLNGNPTGSFNAGLVSVPLGILDPSDGVQSITYDVRVTAACAGLSVPNQGLILSSENPAGDRTDDPRLPGPQDVTAVQVGSVQAEVLMVLGRESLIAGDPNNCDQPRLDPSSDLCVDCIETLPDRWVWRDGLALEGAGVRYFELPGRACPTAGDPEVLCLAREGAQDLALFLADATSGCP